MTLFILSRRTLDTGPAMCCMAELENVLARDYGAQIHALPQRPQKVGNGDTVFCLLLAFYQLGEIEAQLAAYKQAGAKIIVYFFDAWDASTVLYSRRRRAKDIVAPGSRFESIVDRLCVPFRSVIDSLEPRHRAIAVHVPLAADTSLTNGLNSKRPFPVLAYGSQPREISNACAQAMNRPESDRIFHHTDHLAVGRIIDPAIHRMHFWKMLQSAQITLAYDPRLTSPMRVPDSVVGQRWYEAIAAGCVVAGKRPTTSEAQELLDWEDATIDLPDSPDEAVKALYDLLEDSARIARIRERNVENARARHDWRHRIPLMLGT